ncbi:MAG: hypothetical protein EXQ49_05790 [Acidobacteria bacterium]|nr:hypothetical protein [Acidobacteriota bacterium]
MRTRHAALAFVLVATVLTLGLAQPTAVQVGLAGQVTTRTRDGGSPATSVVYAEPIGGAAPRLRAATATMAQKNKSFAPRVMGIPVGTTVTFLNEDAIFHNAFSLSASQPFDLGLYRGGASKDRVFSQPSVYNVFCNIHPQMVAFVVVAPTPWVTTTGADGAWRLDVPEGRYRVTAISERAAPVSVEVQVAGNATSPVRITLDGSAFVQAPRTDKFGKPYPASAYKGK